MSGYVFKLNAGELYPVLKLVVAVLLSVISSFFFLSTAISSLQMILYSSIYPTRQVVVSQTTHLDFQNNSRTISQSITNIILSFFNDYYFVFPMYTSSFSSDLTRFKKTKFPAKYISKRKSTI